MNFVPARTASEVSKDALPHAVSSMMAASWAWALHAAYLLTYAAAAAATI